MKEKRKNKHTKKDHTHKTEKKWSSSPSSSESDKWVEKEQLIGRPNNQNNRDDWMSMTGIFRTFSKDDFKSKDTLTKSKNHIDSYNPGTSTKELNPYWKDGGLGVPQTSEEYRKSKPFMKPIDEDDYYSKSSTRYLENQNESYKKSCNWKKETANSSSKHKDDAKSQDKVEMKCIKYTQTLNQNPGIDKYHNKVERKGIDTPINKKNADKYLNDEKLNKLAAKIVKAEIMGDTKLVSELKAKLEAAREYRKHNVPPDEDERVMLISTNSAGNSRPLTNSKGDSRSKGGKRKADTHNISGERTKYFANDDKYDLAQMFQNEKYGNNYDQEAQLATIAAKHINPNDDLEDIFTDNISKNKNDAKDNERERQRAINEHNKIEKSLEGCEYCLDSKNMIKHLMVSCGRKVYLALPSTRSLVKGQCIITTIQHHTCVTAIDEDVWEEILNFRKALTIFFDSQGKDVLFYETATKLYRYPHLVINCMPLPRDVGDSASIYFKKALLECEAEWSMNKKVVDLKGKNIRKGIPIGLPYFWIDFAMEPGFAHVIEDQKFFPKNFAEEIIGGILDLDHHLWKNPSKEYGDLQRKKVSEFLKEWKPFDTVSVNRE